MYSSECTEIVVNYEFISSDIANSTTEVVEAEGGVVAGPLVVRVAAVLQEEDQVAAVIQEEDHLVKKKQKLYMIYT